MKDPADVKNEDPAQVAAGRITPLTATTDMLTITLVGQPDGGVSALDFTEAQWPQMLSGLRRAAASGPPYASATVAVGSLAFALDRLTQLADVAMGNGAEVSRQVVRIASLENALRTCRDAFAYYARNHREKGTADGVTKAQTNEALVEMIDNLLRVEGA